MACLFVVDWLHNNWWEGKGEGCKRGGTEEIEGELQAVFIRTGLLSMHPFNPSNIP